MAAIAPERPVTRLPHDRYRTDLSQGQREEHDRLMALLGYENGSVADDEGLTAPADRQATAQLAAQNAGMALPEGHEIRDCNNCDLIFDADDAHENEGLIHCEDCNQGWALANDGNYGRDDTTFESRWD